MCAKLCAPSIHFVCVFLDQLEGHVMGAPTATLATATATPTGSNGYNISFITVPWCPPAIGKASPLCILVETPSQEEWKHPTSTLSLSSRLQATSATCYADVRHMHADVITSRSILGTSCPGGSVQSFSFRTVPRRTSSMVRWTLCRESQPTAVQSRLPPSPRST